MESVLFWDLREDATRATLLEQTFAVLPESERTRVVAQRDNASFSCDHYYNLSAVMHVIDALEVSKTVKQDLCAIYRLLAQAEATAHHCEIDQTHFHEVGNAAAIRNALGICLAVEAVAPREVVATSIQTGQGTVQCAHGTLPIPAPATAALIARGIPTCKNKLDGERCTPTSAAMILHFVNRFVA